MNRLIHALLDAAGIALDAPWRRIRQAGTAVILAVVATQPNLYMGWIQARYQPQLEAITASVLDSVTDVADTSVPVHDRSATTPDLGRQRD